MAKVEVERRGAGAVLSIKPPDVDHYVEAGTQRFPRIMGVGNALYMLHTGVRIGVDRAFAMGFVQEVVPAGHALGRAMELAERIASYAGQPGLLADRASTIAAYDQPL